MIHFPQIEDAQKLNSHQDGFVKNGSEQEYCSILTIEVENALVWHIKNKNGTVYHLFQLFQIDQNIKVLTATTTTTTTTIFMF